MEGLSGILAFILAAIITSLFGGMFGDADIFDGFFGVVVGIGSIAALTSLFFKMFENIFSRIREFREESQFKQQVQRFIHQEVIDEEIYENARNSYKYFSNAKIIELIEEKDQMNPFEQLALEEIAFERGLINHSEMHEKINSLNRRLNN